MTVSPKRPLDGNRQSRTDRNQEATGSISDASALPPVLFKLPNIASETKLAVPAQSVNQPPPMPLPGTTGVQSTHYGAPDPVANGAAATNAQRPTDAANPGWSGNPGGQATPPHSPPPLTTAAARDHSPRDPMAGIQVAVAQPAPVRQIAAQAPPAQAPPAQPVAADQGVVYPTPGQAERVQPAAPGSVTTGPAPEAGPTDAATTEPQRRSFAGRSSADNDVRPAGRTWAEAVMAHRAVLSLLAIVIAVALWTSRGTSDSTDVDSMAEVDEAFEIETGELATSFPSADSFATSPPAVGSSAGFPGSSNPGSAATDEGNEDHASVALNPPEPSAPDADDLSRSISDRDRANASPSFGQSGVPASTVSSRTPGGLPSLEDLVAGPEATDLGSPANAPPASRGELEFTGPEPSRTPQPVQDWSRYFPPTATPVSSLE